MAGEQLPAAALLSVLATVIISLPDAPALFMPRQV